MKKYILFATVASLLGFVLTACANTYHAASTDGVGQNQSDGIAPPTVGGPGTSLGFDLKAQVDLYKQRYGARDPYTKIVDNEGNGYPGLYGTRNMRTVLYGIYYRGGANNVSNTITPRPNMNPLPTAGLEKLCEQGFTESTYLYSTNYNTAPAVVTCKTLSGGDGVLHYNQISALVIGNEDKLLGDIYAHIKGTISGPVYDHCWNGWHASGYVAAISLRQFCGWSSTQADSYWVQNTDGNSVGASYDAIRARIRAFVPTSKYMISKDEQDLICP